MRRHLPYLLWIILIFLMCALGRKVFGVEKRGDTGTFRVCRLVYNKATSDDADGDGWDVDYPRADRNLTRRLSELTKTPTSEGIAIRLSDPRLFQCPILLVSEPGSITIADEDARNFQLWLARGGFMWVDDFWGEKAWAWWEGQIGKVLPADRYPRTEITADHPLRNMLYEVRNVPQIPNIGLWLNERSRTSERGADSSVPHLRGITDVDTVGRDGRGRVIVVATFNTDLGDSFEEEGADAEYLLKFSVPGYALGVDILLYAMTH